MIGDLNANEGVALVDETQRKNDQDMFDTSILVAKKEVSTADPVTTADEVVTTAGVKTSKPKSKGIVMQEPSETPTPTLIDSFQQPSNAKDKGKAKIIKPKKPLKRKDQIMIDEEDNTQATMDADYELASKLQEEERGKLIVEKKSRLFVELMDKRNKYFARLRDENIKKSFVPMDTELMEGSEKAAEGSSKRARDKLEQEDAKRKRIEEENESVELKRFLEIIPDSDDDVTIEATPLSSKSLTIVDYKIYKEGRKIFFKIIRADVNVGGYMLQLLRDYNCWKSLC
nr:hypothetical protein [Tanacetum cinerariifolium]